MLAAAVILAIFAIGIMGERLELKRLDALHAGDAVGRREAERARIRRRRRSRPWWIAMIIATGLFFAVWPWPWILELLVGRPSGAP